MRDANSRLGLPSGASSAHAAWQFYLEAFAQPIEQQLFWATSCDIVRTERMLEA
jgi:hypothetical protein